MKFSLYLGCPVWSCGQWAGDVYPQGTRREQWLNWYGKTFNTVEGNSSFYALPTCAMVQRWCDDTPAHFRFALKFPRLISHELRLRSCAEPLRAWLQVLAVLAERGRLGPAFLQLPPNFSGAEFDNLSRFLRALPREFPWAVEVRHRDWFDEGEQEKRLREQLQTLAIDTVLFDSRALFQAPPGDPHEQEAQGRKPQTPYRQTTTGKSPMLRFIGRNSVAQNQAFIDQWVPVVIEWLRQGLTPYVFTHTADDRFAPQFARAFAAALSKSAPEFSFDIPKPPQPPQQQPLFD